jgi:hypothetical protein
VKKRVNDEAHKDDCVGVVSGTTINESRAVVLGIEILAIDNIYHVDQGNNICRCKVRLEKCCFDEFRISLFRYFLGNGRVISIYSVLPNQLVAQAREPFRFVSSLLQEVAYCTSDVPSS